MVRIVYGVSGEGSGHSSRAREIITHLQSAGHIVKVATYDRGYRNLREHFDVLPVVGLHIASTDNRVSALKTLTRNINAVPKGKKSLENVKETLFKRFQPDCVITDMEPMTAYLANHYGIPLVSLDNQHRMRYMRYPCPIAHRKDAFIAENIIRAMVPKPSVSLITTFYYGRLKNSRSFLFPPIVRREVMNLRPTQGKHILVYVTAGFRSLLDELRTFTREKFLVYGYERSDTQKPLYFKPFSSEDFLRDLSSARAVVATAGFTLMTESFYLGKPCLSFPMRGQFEQVLNGIMLEELGYGKAVSALTRDSIAAFLYDVPHYAHTLRDYTRQGNGAITGKLDELLAGDCHMLKQYYKRRFQKKR